MEKILRKYTTIPLHLYVKRNADKQLKNIIEEMERPGYVLVARQMGKTNLLFNAIREYENEHRLFAYVDLSNLFTEERDCYRNIIDCILEPNEELFENIEKTIYTIREDNLPPNKEYSKSLKIILKEFKGDIVIILDEIDALRSVEYSDHIFAQIRSSYFARTKQPIFANLTYILSGVIEPTELIKDRNKSPFNIGEKIYLDDFSKSEHDIFIEKSKLKIEDSISQFIYSWTNGNPRLTFDICADIESKIIEGEEINEGLVNNVIKEKYLVNFDIAPVDHIRELIISNKNVRNAVVNIQKGINNISDEIKKKLYLYGIINSSFDEKTFIKNKIISESLSLEWLTTLEKESRVTLTSALYLYENQEYKQAQDSFIKVLQEDDNSEKEIEMCHYFIGYCSYMLQDFNKAKEYFSFNFESDDYKRNALSFSGICELAGDKEKGLEILEKVTLVESNDFAYHNALLNISINILEENKDRAFELLNTLYSSTFKSISSKENDLDELRTLSLYYQATILLDKKEFGESSEKLREALKYSSISNSLFLMYFDYIINERENENLKDKILNTLIDNNISFDRKTHYPINFNENHVKFYIELAYDDSNLELFEKTIDYLSSLFNGNKNKYELVYESSIFTVNNKEGLLVYLYSNKDNLSETLCYDVLRALISFYSSKENKSFKKYFTKYLEINKNMNIIDSDDVFIYAMAIKTYLTESENYNLDFALELCNIIDSKIQSMKDEMLNFESLIIYYWFAIIYADKKDEQKSLEYSNKTLTLIKESKEKRTSAIDEEGVLSISKQMNEIKSSFIKRVPIRNEKKYGRNEKVHVEYTTGIKKFGKYKTFESDIKSKRCKIIED